MYISIKISENISKDFVQVINSSPVNFSADVVLTGFTVVSVVLILGVNSAIIKSLFSKKWTFVNFIVLVDCGNALGHIPVISQYFWLMVVMNRSIPVAIAIYRYALVFYYDLMYDKRQKKRLQLILTAYTAVLAPHIRGPWSSLNRYVVCMGREEGLFLERNVFNSSEHTHETIIQLCIAFFCYSFVPLVPYCYIKIYLYRKKQKKLGLKEEELKNRKMRNIVTFRYNMTVWVLDTATMLLAFGAMVAAPDYFDLVGVLMVLVTCGVNPGLYLLGMREDRNTT